MRKLVYVEKNGNIETTSYEEMLKMKEMGMNFKEELRDIPPKRDYTRARKIAEIEKEKRKKA